MFLIPVHPPLLLLLCLLQFSAFIILFFDLRLKIDRLNFFFWQRLRLTALFHHRPFMLFQPLTCQSRVFIRFIPAGFFYLVLPLAYDQQLLLMFLRFFVIYRLFPFSIRQIVFFLLSGKSMFDFMFFFPRSLQQPLDFLLTQRDLTGNGQIPVFQIFQSALCLLCLLILCIAGCFFCQLPGQTSVMFQFDFLISGTFPQFARRTFRQLFLFLCNSQIMPQDFHLPFILQIRLICLMQLPQIIQPAFFRALLSDIFVNLLLQLLQSVGQLLRLFPLLSNLLRQFLQLVRQLFLLLLRLLL